MKLPHVWTPQGLINHANTIAHRLPSGQLVPIRGEQFDGLRLRRRLYLTWRVFTGKADVLEWR